MDVSLTDEQREWQAALDRLASTHALAGADLVDATDLAGGWATVLEVGVPALRSPALSGVDAAGVESVLAVEAVARTLSCLPVLGQASIAADLLARAGADGALGQVLDGTLRFAPSFTADLGGFGRTGNPVVAFDVRGATHVLALDEANRLVAFELAGDGDLGLDLTRSVRAASDLGAAVDVDLGDALDRDALDRAHAFALCALSADLLGVMSGAVADAVAYAGERKQFGVPIGTFQAVQHLIADAAVAIEGARSCLWHAAWAGDHLPADEAVLAARVAKAYCSDAGLKVVEATVQVFGGIAITWEHLSHVRLRRTHLSRRCLGDEHVHHRAIAQARTGAA